MGRTKTGASTFTIITMRRKKDYYLIYQDGDPDSLLVMASADGKELTNVSDEEYAEAEEMLETYEKDPKIQSLK
jgi:hypothetical protein